MNIIDISIDSTSLNSFLQKAREENMILRTAGGQQTKTISAEEARVRLGLTEES